MTTRARRPTLQCVGVSRAGGLVAVRRTERVRRMRWFTTSARLQSIPSAVASCRGNVNRTVMQLIKATRATPLMRALRASAAPLVACRMDLPRECCQRCGFVQTAVAIRWQRARERARLHKGWARPRARRRRDGAVRWGALGMVVAAATTHA